MTVRRTGFAITLVPLLILAACAPTSFDDLIGVNLISGIEFSDPGWLPDQSSVYMVLEEATGETFTDGTPACRLEIKNLFSNGDFEASTVGSTPAGWSLQGAGAGGAGEYATVVNDSSSIVGNSLSFNVNPNDRLSFDLLAGALDGLISETNYIVRFSFTLTQNQLLLSYNDGSTDAKTWTIPTVPGTLSQFPPPPSSNPPNPGFMTLAGDSSFLSLNTVYVPVGTCTGLIDNIKLTRSDIPYRIGYTVPFSRAGRPDLVPGTYRFSAYVKTDPAVTPGARNRFPATGVSLAIDDLTGGSASYTALPTAYHPTDEGADWSAWTLVTCDTPVTTIPSASTPEAPMILLSLTPTDTLGGTLTMDVGSILIAKPSLEFIP